jgi:hypothetical protein
MELVGPLRYRVSILPASADGGLFEVCDDQGRSKFSVPATSSVPKLYVVTGEQAPIYVGITKQSMRTRLRLGWTATGQTGYYGYKWRRGYGYEEVALDIWCDMSPVDENPMLDIETVEAEVVFLIRQMGDWPLHQTEIHFHPSLPEHRDAAKAIVSRYLGFL